MAASGYIYLGDGQYINRAGNSVGFDEVFNNYVLPNATVNYEVHAWHDYVGTTKNPKMYDKGVNYTLVKYTSKPIPMLGYTATIYGLSEGNEGDGGEGSADGGKGFKNKLNTTGQIAALSGTANAVKSQLFNFAERTSSIPLKNLNYVKGVNEIGIAGILFGMGVSGYNMYSDYSQFGTVNGWDVADFGVGVASLGATIFLASNPVGWVIVGGGTVYCISRAIYDARTNE